MSTRTMVLPDGRSLAYVEYGDPAGVPVLYCHGMPGTRLEPECARLPLGARLIAPDRPGFGRSESDPGRDLLRRTDDLAALADHLGLERFSVLGFSGGAPHALACGHRLAERIERIAIVSGLAPFDRIGGPPAATRPYYEAVRADPAALRAELERQVPDGEALWRLMTGDLPPADRRVFESAPIARSYRRNMAEALRQGVGAIVTELDLAAAAWPFALEGVECPVHLWQGTDDANTPPDMGRALADGLPSARLRLLPRRGHFFLLGNWRRVLAHLIADCKG